MSRFFVCALVFATAMNSVSAFAQGVLVIPHSEATLPRVIWPHHRPSHGPEIHRPTSTYKIKELDVNARIVDQVARVQVTQSFVNTGTVQMEVQFLFPLPYDGAIDQLTLLVDGKEVAGKLMGAKDARAVYESIVRSNKDPALLEWMGTGLFQTSVFPVPAGAERKVILNYNQVLRRDRGLTDFQFPLGTARYSSHPPEKIDVRVSIESATEIKNVYSPSNAVEVKRPDPKHAVINYSRINEVPSGDFRLLYDVDKSQVGASVISYRPASGEDGFFLLLASPQIKSTSIEKPKKTVVFVVDRSGSMSGKKFEQARAALKFVLNNLRDDDLFNIIAYDNAIESFRPELERFNDETRRAAIGFVEGLSAGGGTNIHGALTKALGQLKDDARPNYLLFLTDGLPTVGITKEAEIARAAKEANRVRARVLTFGVGYDVNSRLLDRISTDNFGVSEYVRPDEDIESHVSAAYANISSPVLTDVTINFQMEGFKPEDGPPVNRIYPKANFDLFEGQSLVIAGRYRRSGPIKFSIKGKLDGNEQSFEFPATLVDKSEDQTYAFVEKLWAMRRIGEIIDQIDLSGKNDELVKELVELSTRHGILTPYTSFLADEAVRPSLSNTDSLRRANLGLTRLATDAEGVGGFTQRAEKNRLRGANYFDTSKPAPSKAVAESRPAKPAQIAGNTYRNIDTDEEVAADSVRQIGNQALYVRNRPGKKEQIVVTTETADLDPDKDADKIEVVDRFSEPYFVLIQANTATENQILSQQRDGEQLLIKLRGKNILVR